VSELYAGPNYLKKYGNTENASFQSNEHHWYPFKRFVSKFS